ncbi:MAG: thiamine phosphate synthase [Pseudomonadota bacterium]
MTESPKSHHPAWRIIDANLNRAREALRVVEDYARFVLDDAGLSGFLKEMRHTLGQATVNLETGVQPRGEPHPSAAARRRPLLARRDILGDVGCEVATPTEYERADLFDVACASAKRLTEALRTIEEYGKLLDLDFAKAVEQVRYRAYEAERRLGLTVSSRERFGSVGLYVILTESLCRLDWFATAEAVLRGGADCLQLREKNLPDRELIARATRLKDLCHDHGSLFVVNDRADIAAQVGADGVHVGQDDMPVAAARRVLPPTALVGVSTHTEPQVRAAASDLPDYIAVGPMFETRTKPRTPIAGPEMLVAARRETSLPLVAIGGIDEHNAEQVLSATPCTLCVCTFVIADDNPQAAASRLCAIIDRATRPP